VITSHLEWDFAGPITYVRAFGGGKNDDGPPKLVSAGAIQNVVQAANQTWFIGGVNGGIW
jgi:hypothetical protein